MRFFNFPKKQQTYIAYTHRKLLKHRLFETLYFQVMPRNSLISRFLLSKFSRRFQFLSQQNIEVPHEGEYLCLIKPTNFILFEFDNNNTPNKVWRKDNNNKWDYENFLGYPLILNYSLSEFEIKLPLIKKALESHWKNINDNPTLIHGDYTHSNVLISSKLNSKLILIDNKSNNHSKLFDIFYFYSYYIQGVNRSKSNQLSDKKIIQEKLARIIKSICVYPDEKSLEQDIQDLNIPNLHGLYNVNDQIIEFKNLFANSL